jgi:hypothetical protein
MRESRVITAIWWEPSQGFDVRGSLTFSDATKVRLDPEDFRLKLKLNADFRYPTDPDLSVRSRTFEPAAVRMLEVVEVFATIPRDDAGNPLASVKLRLFDGTDERFWDGGTWAVAGPGDWSTEAEVNANLAAFDVVSSRRFAVVLNLETTDDRVTPEVECVLVLWRGPVDWVDDVLVDSLVGMLQDELTLIDDLALPPLEADSTSIDLNLYTDEHSLKFTGADAVFDHDADPDHLIDLLLGYDVGTRILTLSAPIPAGNRPFLRMTVDSTVAWETAQDFEELARLPSIVLRDTETVVSTNYPDRSKLGAVDRATGVGYETRAPYRATYEVTAEVSVDRTTTQMRLIEELMWILTHGPSTEVGPFLRSVATDRRYRLRLIDEFRAVDPKLNLADVRTFETTFRIEDTALDLLPARAVHAIQRFNMTFASVRAEDEARAEIQGAPVPTTPPESIEVS